MNILSRLYLEPTSTLVSTFLKSRSRLLRFELGARFTISFLSRDTELQQLGSFGFANKTQIRIIYIRTNFSIHPQRLSSQSSLQWDGSGCEVVTLVSGLHHNWVFRNVLCLNTNHLHHACSLVGVLMKNHKLLSAPSHKTITQAKEKHNFAAKMTTWLLNHSARDVVYDVTPPPHKLNQAKDT